MKVDVVMVNRKGEPNRQTMELVTAPVVGDFIVIDGNGHRVKDRAVDTDRVTVTIDYEWIP